MEEKLKLLFNECIKELQTIGIDILNFEKVGKIDIKISTRNNKRYACCKQEKPNENTKHIKKNRKSINISYDIFKEHHIEVSSWVMELDDSIIKNTIMHELIHCLPYCNNHGKVFKYYAKIINYKLGYNIKTVGNKETDYENSNLEYPKEEKQYNYKIICEKCGIEIYRKRLKKDLISKYRCGKCGGKLQLVNK